MPDKDAKDALDPEFIHLVRSALVHLYDYAYLQNHPLVFMLDVDRNLDHVTRAQKVRRILLECVEALRPQAADHDRAEAARTIAILTYRYVDGLSVDEIIDKLALSRRQVYREHAKGIEAVASLLWDRIREESRDGHPLPPVVQDFAGGRLEIAQAEVARLQQTVHAESLNLRSILEGVFKLLAPRIEQTGIQIEMPSPGTWPSIVADRVMLRQALLNVLSYTLDVVQGDLVITVSCQKEDLLMHICESSLIDSAEPVPLSSSKRTGVGLAVAQALLEAQGGRLEINEHEGKWQAQILLPTSGRMTLLVVDDNANLVALFKRYLGGHEVSVVGATDGEQALHLAAELQPQAITLDVMMPNQDGWEILQRLKSSPDTQHIPVIVCSVLNEPQLALAMGASDYLTKPVSQFELLDVLRRWLGTLRPVA
jgi:CheY-like chemotaxis protein